MKSFILSLLILIIINPIFAQVLKQGYSGTIVADGLNPVAMTVDHHGRLWLAEKDGKVYIINENDILQPEPVIEIEVDEFNERGLMGIALHPDFDEHPYLYLYFTVAEKNKNRISRYEVSGDFVVPSSEEIILDLDPLSGSIHNGGAMLFDKNGYLFIATGDSGFAPNAQMLDNLLGKILRVNADGSIPTDNPYSDILEGKNKAIWSIGHRNPFNLIYDEVNDRIFSSDVGAGDYEEINLVKKGQNYGWPTVEGPLSSGEPPTDYEDPYFYYDHSQGCAIVGLGYMPIEHNFPDKELSNAIFYADYCRGYINYLKDGQPSQVVQLANEIERPLNIVFNKYNNTIYVQTRSGLGGGSQADNTTTSQGKIWKLFYTGNGKPRITSTPEDMILAKGEAARFEINAVGSMPIEYIWYVNEEIYSISDSNLIDLSFDSLAPLNLDIYCIVSNEEGRDTSEVFHLTILDDTRPLVKITSPLSSTKYSAGDTIHFSGEIFDDEDGLIDSTQFLWKVQFHHDLHTHPFIDKLEGIRSGQFVIPTSGEPDTNVWMSIHLSGVDDSGLQGKDNVHLFPEINKLVITSNFGGRVNVDGAYHNLPYDLPSVVNLQRTIEVPQQQILGNYMLIFSQWENGSEVPIRQLQVKRGSIDTIGILFDTIRLGNGQGLYAEYFNDAERDFDEAPIVTRIDTTIDFRWGDGSPEKDLINNDDFTVRWRGFLHPVFQEAYKLYFNSDDGCRIWINDELIIDDWIDHPPKEHEISLDTFSGDNIKLVVEYFESGGGALAELKWSSARTNKKIIPKSQLQPMGFGHIHGRIWYDINRDSEIQQEEPYIPDATIVLLDWRNNFAGITIANVDGFFAFRDLEIGNYRILIIPPKEYVEKLYGYHLDELGYSSFFSIKADELIEDRFAFQDFLSNTNEVDEFVPSYLYPNPVQDILTVNPIISNIEEVSIFSVDGILKSRINLIQKEIQLNFTGYKPGIYLVGIKSKGIYSYFKVVKI